MSKYFTRFINLSVKFFLYVYRLCVHFSTSCNSNLIILGWILVLYRDVWVSLPIIKILTVRVYNCFYTLLMLRVCIDYPFLSVCRWNLLLPLKNSCMWMIYYVIRLGVHKCVLFTWYRYVLHTFITVTEIFISWFLLYWVYSRLPLPYCLNAHRHITWLWFVLFPCLMTIYVEPIWSLHKMIQFLRFVFSNL